jgi:hypothetical protein
MPLLQLHSKQIATHFGSKISNKLPKEALPQFGPDGMGFMLQLHSG